MKPDALLSGKTTVTMAWICVSAAWEGESSTFIMFVAGGPLDSSKTMLSVLGLNRLRCGSLLL